MLTIPMLWPPAHEALPLEPMPLESCSVALTAHARSRATRRNLRREEIEYVQRYARVLHRTGAIFYFLCHRDIPRRDRRWAARLAGTVIVAACDGDIITVYRNQRALREIQRKLKYRLWPDPPRLAMARDAWAAPVALAIDETESAEQRSA